MFLYTTNRGGINVCDFRESSNFHSSPTLSFKVPSRKAGSNLFDKWINAVGDAQFVPGHDHAIVSRDYTSLRMWDMRMASSNNALNSMQVDSEAKPVYSAQVNDYLECNLSNLLQNNNIIDQFNLAISPNGQHIATGSYNKSSHVVDIAATTNQTLECKYDQARDTPVGNLKIYGNKKRLIANGASVASSPSSSSYRKTVSMCAWSPAQVPNQPNKQILAQVFRNCIYLYHSGSQTKTQ